MDKIYSSDKLTELYERIFHKEKSDLTIWSRDDFIFYTLIEILKYFEKTPKGGER